MSAMVVTIKIFRTIEVELIKLYCSYFSLKGKMQLNDTGSINYDSL